MFVRKSALKSNNVLKSGSGKLSYSPDKTLTCNKCPPKPPCCPKKPKPTPVIQTCGKKVIVINNDITRNTRWLEGCDYYIAEEVHVRVGATLTIAKGTTVLFKDGPLEEPREGGLPYASLVVDSGASIVAKNVEFRNEIGAHNNTGGVIIVGTRGTNPEFGTTFEGYDTVSADPTVPAGKSHLSHVSFNYLGNHQAKLNTLTLFRANGSGGGSGEINEEGAEVLLDNISISHAGDDGLEIFSGNHAINRLSIFHSLDDDLSLDWNATLVITESLTLVRNSPTDSVGDTLGNALINVVGALGSFNILFVQEGAYRYLSGKYLDEIGLYNVEEFPTPIRGNIFIVDLLTSLAFIATQ